MTACRAAGGRPARRRLLLGGLCLAGLGVATPSVAGAGSVSLAACGGRPGASRAELVGAFARAFDLLRSAGGGVLDIAPGAYDFGRQAEDASIIPVEGLHDVRIRAHGALFLLDTVASVTPCLFYFVNPVNVVFEGASFSDAGYDPHLNWRGMVCVRVEATVPVRGFALVQCAVDGAVALFQCHQHGRHKFLVRGIRLQGTVSNAYYGASLTYAGDDADVDLACENVRRGCMSYGLRNAAIRMRMLHARGQPASNGFISLACEGASAGNVGNVRIALESSGPACHGSLIHFYHQQQERAGEMANIRAHVKLSGMREGDSALRVFLFDHEVAGGVILRRTARTWSDISLSGEIGGRLHGRLVDNPSASISPCSIRLDPALSAHAALSGLPAYFHATARPRGMAAGQGDNG